MSRSSITRFALDAATELDSISRGISDVKTRTTFFSQFIRQSIRALRADLYNSSVEGVDVFWFFYNFCCNNGVIERAREPGIKVDEVNTKLIEYLSIFVVELEDCSIAFSKERLGRLRDLCLSMHSEFLYLANSKRYSIA